MEKTGKQIRKIMIVLLTGLLFVCGCGKKTEQQGTAAGTMTVGPWLAQINDEFGMSVYDSDTPYTDVGKGDPYFSDIQIAYEWGILTEEDRHIKTSDVVTEEFAAKTLVRAVGFQSVDGMSDEEIYQLAENEGYVEIEEKDGVLSEEEAASCLADASGIWREGNYGEEAVADYVFAENTADLSSLTPSEVSYDTEANTVTVPSSSIPEMNIEAKVGVLPDENGNIQAVYMESVTDNGDGTVTIQLAEGVPDTSEVFTSLKVSVPKKQQNLLESVIYDGNGNLVYDGLSDETASSVVFQVLSIGTQARPVMKDVIYTMNFGAYLASCKITDSSMNVTVTYKETDGAKMEVVGQFEINNITPSFTNDQFLGIPTYARAQIDYNVVQKLDIKAEYSTDLKLAPYNNGNGKFATNLKKALKDGWKDKGAAGAQNIKIGTLDFWIFEGTKVRLDVFLNFSMDGTISVSVSQAQQAGIEFKDGKLRSFFNSGGRKTELNAQVNMDASLYVGLSFYVAEINLAGFGLKPGIRAAASAQVYIADSGNHLLEKVEGLNTDEDRLKMALTGATDVTCYSCFNIDKLEIYGQLMLNEDSAAVKVYKKLRGSKYEGCWELFCIAMIEDQHFEDGKSVPACTRTFTEETSEAAGNETDSVQNPSVQNGETNASNNQITDIIVGKLGIKAESVAVAAQAGRQYQIRITEVPEGYSSDNLKYTSKDESVASVSSQGVVTANKVGSTLIYVQTPDEKYSLSIGIYISN